MVVQLLFTALALVLGAWWCKVIFARIPADVKELKDPDYARRIVIIGLWIVTLIILVFMTRFCWNLFAPGFQALSKR